MEHRDDNPAERLFEMGQHLAEAGKHRFAALTFSTVAMGTSGATPRLRGDATFLAAYHLVEHATGEPEHPHAAEGLLRATGVIQKGLLQAKAMPDGFIRAMSLLALLERVHDTRGESAKAFDTAKRALGEMKGAAEHGEAVWEWWVYFRARQLRHGGKRDKCIYLARTAASLAESRKDPASAAAFHLCAAQMHLTAGRYEHPGPASAAIEAAGRHLAALSEEQLAASAPLRVAHIVLGGMALLRVGHAVDVREQLAQRASRALAALERPRSSRAAPCAVCWVWVALPIMSALLQHIMASAYRTVDEGSAAWVSAERALVAVGLRGDSYAQQSPALSRSVSARAERALRVAFLESAARIRMATCNLGGAHPLVAAALGVCRQGAPDNGVDVPHAAALLLCAEYYTLTGKKSYAQQAVDVLDEVEKLYEGHVPRGNKAAGAAAPLSDVLAMARTHRSLLLGSERRVPEAEGDVEAQELMVGTQVRAAAHFADGVLHMRGSRIMEAKESLQAVFKLVSDGAAANEQLIGSTLCVYAGLYLLYESVPDEAITPARDALRIAERAKDLVNVARSARMCGKLISKAHPNSPAAERALSESRATMQALQRAQAAFVALDK